jgi:SNF2 family DNA or RNA helicase
MARPGGNEDDGSTEDESFISRNETGLSLMTTDQYIESRFQYLYILIHHLSNLLLEIVGAPSSDETDSDIEIIDVKSSNSSSGKKIPGFKVQFSDDEADDDAYEKFKNRKKTKRQRTAAAKRKQNQKAKQSLSTRRREPLVGATSKVQERAWGDVSGDDVVDGEIPEYLVARRKEFDDQYQALNTAGLQLPPRYNDIVFSDDERLADLEERPDFPKTVDPSRPYKDIQLPRSAGIIPASIAQYLRDYQIDGVSFLHELFVYQKGGILGDDMGLGKTVQVAAFLTAAFGKTGDERDAKRMRKMRREPGRPWYPRVLIICPGSLIENWKNELSRWGWWHVDKFHGTKLEKESVLQTATSGRLEVVITTYTTYKNHKDQINLISWDCVVADECHQIKERSSQITQAMDQVNALCRIGLTGTAIQNKYEELWTLLNWTNPGRFGPLSIWESSISKPLRTGQS